MIEKAIAYTVPHMPRRVTEKGKPCPEKETVGT
jgi:hypothetical protein